MDCLTSTDLNRMIQAINHECNLRIKEIKMEATIEYNRLKSKLIEQKEEEIKKEYHQKIKNLIKEQYSLESKTRKEYRLKMEMMKTLLIDKIVDGVRERIDDRSFDMTILEEILTKIRSKNILIFVNERDKERVRENIERYDMKYEIRSMPTEGMGGVIVCSKDGREVWDSSFETRLNVIMGKYMDKINKELFNK